MMYSRLVRSFHIFLLVCCSVPLKANVLQGNAPEGSGQTFTFPTSAHAASPKGDFFYIGAQCTADGSDFAVSTVVKNSNALVPMTPSTVWLNNVADQPNPLFNAGIQFLGLLSPAENNTGLPREITHAPLVVTTNDLTSLYVIDLFFSSRKAVLSANSIKDASGTLVTSGIVGIGNMADQCAIAAVKSNAGGNFGASGSGIAVLKLDTKKTESAGVISSSRVLEQVDAPIGSPVGSQTRALPLDIATPAVKIFNNLVSMNDNAVFHWDANFGRLYVGLQVTGGVCPTDGARSVIMVAPTQTGKFVIQTIAIDAVFANQNEIIGGIGANTQVSVHRINTMYTSTSLHYLIVQGGNGDAASTKRTVYALPLVGNNADAALLGVIANKNQVFNPAYGTFTEPAMDNSQMTTSDDFAASIGGDELLAGDITDMIVRGDTVYVTVSNPAMNQIPGIFYSQALFDSTQKITRWTNWKPVGGSIDPIFGATIDPLYDIISMTGIQGNIITRGMWGTGAQDGLLGGTLTSESVGLVSLLGAGFPKDIAGIQGLFDFPFTTPGLNAQTSLLVATGLNKIVLVETGVSNGTTLVPNLGDFTTDQVTFPDGTITYDLPAPMAMPRVVTIAGGALSDLGPITRAEIGVDNVSSEQSAWLFVGGIDGLAVLSKPDGSGWDPSVGLGPNFVGLTNGMAFKKIGNYEFVRKLMADGHLLYVMTDTKLDVIDLSASNFATGLLSFVTLATPSSALGLISQDTFTDFIVSGQCALLSTSRGLLRVGNGADISTATTVEEVKWTQVTLPQSVGPVTQLFAITSSGRVQDFTQCCGGNIYVLNAYVGYSQAQIARFNSRNLMGSTIDESTLLEIPNFFPGVAVSAPILNFNGFRDLITTDGSMMFSGLDKDLEQPPVVISTTGMKRSVRSAGFVNAKIPLAINSYSYLARMLRSSASGSWLVGGDFGLQVNESCSTLTIT
ncbi:MAG: hypothetical protein NTX86_06040 [Candidatus Dependentiae bacterium]|nr:hypothetical protein [Candidatus Dependentiae bacterium]